MISGVLPLLPMRKNSMIMLHNIPIKEKSNGCSIVESNAFSIIGSWRSPLDNFEPSDDLCTSVAGFGRPKMGKGSGHGIFRFSGLCSNGNQGKA